MRGPELVAEALKGNVDTVINDLDEDYEFMKSYVKPEARLSPRLLSQVQPKIKLNPTQMAQKIGAFPAIDPRVQLRFKRVGFDGRIESLELEGAPYEAPGSAEKLSMTRRMGPKKDAVRGKSGKLPFTPGGIDISATSSIKELSRNHLGLLDRAPGLSRSGKITTVTQGVERVPQTEEDDDGAEEENVKNVDGDEAEEIIAGEEDVVTAPDDYDSETLEPLAPVRFTSIDDLLPVQADFVRGLTASARSQPKQRTWAHLVDIDQEFANFDELVPNPARTWPFELDSFQKEAVYHLERGDSVFIAAHTSAGKTVVAEYAMSMAANHMTKCIYTSPIKALSNQKYRDFRREYDDVGILTGDVQLNPDASTLIMTTEILRSMLYRGADIIRDVEFIIFDEVHYVNDSERGVVWEEVIIMLPDHVKLILLSATVPNTMEFANWVGRTKEKDVYVISTPKRPVPLMHYLWVKKKQFEVVGDDRKFNEKGYKAAHDALLPPAQQTQGGKDSGNSRGGSQSSRGGTRGGSNRGGSTRGGRGMSRGGASSGQQALKRQLGPQQGRYNDGQASKTMLLDLAEHLRTNALLPAVFFVFSRKLCEQYAHSIQSMSLNTGREKSQVYMFMDRAVARLRPEDRELPQIQMLRELLQQGIGVHHSGLLPIMKEVVEILFAKGLVKLLFATETFAMGLNLPTRTVVFTATRKFDSRTMRYLSPGEYTQMAGRAGRRGLDKVGTVIIMNTSKDALIPRSQLEEMILGTPTKLSSQFRLTYNMILSLLHIEAVRVEDVIQQSFSEDATHVLRPELEKRLIIAKRSAQELEKEAESISTKNEFTPEMSDAITSYYRLATEYQRLTTQIYEILAIAIPASIIDRFCFYRVKRKLALGIIQNTRRAENDLVVLPLGNAYAGPTNMLQWLAIGDWSESSSLVNFLHEAKPRNYTYVSVDKVELISAARVRKWHAQWKPSEAELKALQEVFYNKGSDSWQELNLDNIRAVDARLALRQRNELAKELKEASVKVSSALDSHPNSDAALAEFYLTTTKIVERELEIEQIQEHVGLSNTALLPEYEQRVNVLKAATYVDDNLNITVKGRVATEISVGYELYLTELLVDNFLGPFEPEEIVALLSVFVFEGARGAEDPITVTPRLDRGKERVLQIVDYIHGLSAQQKVTLTQDEADFTEKNRFALMPVVYEWARGMNFSEITALTTVQEGLIVRVINRLDEICRSVMSAARIIGEVDLYDKVAIAQEKIKRDIVFCSSLYL